MAGHKTWCRFQNSAVIWNHCGYGLKKEGFQKGDMKEHARMTLREKALKAAEKYTRDVAINTIAFSWPKQAVKDGGL